MKGKFSQQFLLVDNWLKLFCDGMTDVETYKFCMPNQYATQESMLHVTAAIHVQSACTIGLAVVYLPGGN